MNAMLPREAVVVSRHDDTADTRTLWLRLAEPGARMDFAPGQFNMLGLPGIGEIAITFSSLPGEDGSFSHTIRSVGGGSRAITELKPGQKLQVRGPFGSSWPWEALKGKNLIIVAGGSGIVPLRPFLQRCFRERGHVGRVLVLYGARTPGQMLYLDEVGDWRERGQADVRLTVDEVPPGETWQEHIGVVSDLFGHPSEGAPGDVALVCGPELMMRFVIRELTLRGMRAGDIHLSMERRMECGIGHCGHCQLGPYYVCKDGPVFTYAQLRPLTDNLL